MTFTKLLLRSFVVALIIFLALIVVLITIHLCTTYLSPIVLDYFIKGLAIFGTIFAVVFTIMLLNCIP